ncbi:uncharacterized protein LOC109542840 [Dendroctonus ponderosae]|uniref:Protein TsetseEP domain-containing protein n=1 Tax=Dendroctonus ponderosae TaxID=77166 RepID=U4U4B1_DENPD|nr:uncharacterized protein LOC109542840 [Dendroctonus ponderosae]ERL84815.1 hypothetical protein D910_02239 [Dendroctonus ponderosae]KAH1013011.1 hypothetical protein HUJ05_012069 [Dendroctonus ponderosae]KAH1013012.1 hypothetical protein HUJ05_012069 [Dendroctonus ponderosae]
MLFTMNFKVCVTILGTFLAVQASNQSPALTGTTKDIIVQVLDEVLAVVSERLANASAVVDNLQSNPDQIQTKIVDEVQAVVKTLNSEVVDVLNKVRNNASDGGKAIIDCVLAEDDPAEAIIEDATASFGACISNDTSVVLAAISDGLDQLTQLVADIQAPVNTLSSCSSSDTICLLSFATSEVAVLKTVPDLVQEYIAQWKKIYSTISADATECAASARSEYKSQIMAVFEDSVQCILNIKSN